MAWNEPGNGEKDPWGNRGNDGPPDLDEVVRNLQKKLGGIFGGGSTSGNDNNGSQGTLGLGLIALIIIAVWMASGFYTVDQSERGVVLRFGQYVKTTSPGFNWRFPSPIESHEIVNVTKSRTETIGYRSRGTNDKNIIPSESLMLTQDENIIHIEAEIQYRVNDPVAYLFNVEDPSATLRQMTESAVREVVGQTTMDDVLKIGYNEMAAKAKILLQGLLDQYQTGLFVTTFNIPDIQAPPQVRDAFADVIKAGADQVRMKNQAEAYANDILPRARGNAFRLIQEAEAYKEQVIAKAEGEASRFTQVKDEYEKAPDITRERLYLDTMESVYQKSQKVMVDVENGGSNVLYLPLDRLRSSTKSLEQSSMDQFSFPSTGSSSTSSSSSTTDDARSRGGR